MFFDGDKYKLELKINNEILIANYYKNEFIDFKLGEKINACGKTNIPSSNTVPNTFNYKKYLNNKKIFYILTIDNYEIVDNQNIKLIYKVKNYILNRIDDIKNSEYLKAFILGDKNNLEEYNLYTNNGVSHLFALSGMHISLLTGILLFIFKRNSKKDFFIILFLIFYLFLTNFSASLTRSVVFFILLQINRRFNFNIKNIYILLLTIMIIIGFNYLIIFDIGFIYSSVITFALILSSKYFKKNYFYNLFVTSSIAFLFSMPITLYMNYEINIISVFNNLILVPLISLIIYPLSLIVFFFPFISPVYSLLINLLEFINNILNYIGIYLIVPKVSVIFYIIYYLFLICFIISNEFKYIVFSFLLIFLLKIKPYISSNINVYFLDVKQGDSAVITHKNDVILIDTGGVINFDVSDNTIRFLKSLGYGKVTAMIISHGDYDHMGEAINVINNYKVKKVIFNCGSFNELEQDLIKFLDKKNIQYYSCIKELNIDNNKLYFLNNGNYDNENDNSNVIYTELGGYKFMFMGDAGVEVEEDLIEKYNIQGIDVLKVGHHGSKTSSGEEFIESIKPKYSIISVGKNNRYGHPNDGVVENLNDSKIYRTDQDGSVMFKIKNNKLKIETCAP